MKAVWSDHARQRIKARNIRTRDVLKTIFEPDWYEPTHFNRIKVQKRIHGRILEVIYIEEKESMIIITCYFL